MVAGRGRLRGRLDGAALRLIAGRSASADTAAASGSGSAAGRLRLALVGLPVVGHGEMVDRSRPARSPPGNRPGSMTRRSPRARRVGLHRAGRSVRPPGVPSPRRDRRPRPLRLVGLGGAAGDRRQHLDRALGGGLVRLVSAVRVAAGAIPQGVLAPTSRRRRRSGARRRLCSAPAESDRGSAGAAAGFAPRGRLGSAMPGVEARRGMLRRPARSGCCFGRRPSAGAVGRRLRPARRCGSSGAASGAGGASPPSPWLKRVPSAMISAISSSVSRQAVPLPIATTPTWCLPTRSLRTSLASDRRFWGGCG